MNKKYFPKEQIKMVVSDFDGVFTDGKLTIYSDGTTSKNVDYKDIMAIANIIKQDIKFVIMNFLHGKLQIVHEGILSNLSEIVSFFVFSSSFITSPIHLFF